MLENSEKYWIKLEIELSPLFNFMTLGTKLNRMETIGKLCYILKVRGP